MNRLDDVANTLVSIGYDPRKWENLVTRETNEIRVDLTSARAVLKVTEGGAMIISTPIRLTGEFSTEVLAIVSVLKKAGICVS